MHASFDLPGAIPFLLRLHEQRPVGAGERRQDRLDCRDADLEIHTSAERGFERSSHPISVSAALLQHDLSPVEIEVREAFIGAVEEHREAAYVAPEPQTFVD